MLQENLNKGAHIVLYLLFYFHRYKSTTKMNFLKQNFISKVMKFLLNLPK